MFSEQSINYEHLGERSWGNLHRGCEAGMTCWSSWVTHLIFLGLFPHLEKGIEQYR